MLKFFRLPFATTGDKTVVPDPVDSNGNVSYSQGYGFDYQRQKTDPAAKNIDRAQNNQILFDITTAIAEIQSQGVPDFITSALNGGTAYSYAANALVRYSGDVYISLTAANTADPTDATKWALFPTPARIQGVYNASAVAGGTADAITATFTPAIAALPAAPGTLFVLVRAGAANATTTPTFSPNGLTAKTIVKGNNTALTVGDIVGAGHWLYMQYDATLDKWVLLNPATGVATRTTTNDATFADDSTSPASTGWVRGAMSAIFTAAGFVLDSTYIKFPSFLGGLIVQWGTTAVPSGENTDATTTLGISYPTAHYACVLVDSATTTNNAVVWAVNNRNLSNFTAHWARSGMTLAGTSRAALYISIGK